MNKMRPKAILILLLPLLALVLGFSGGSPLDLSMDLIEVNLQPELPSAVELPWAAKGNYVTVRIDTRLLRGTSWRLWIAPRGQSGGNPGITPQMVRWEARAPFVNGSLLPQQRALAGQGPIDGRVLQDNFIFFARGDAQSSGSFTLPVDFILEVLP
jgi:hypothetical protein